MNGKKVYTPFIPKEYLHLRIPTHLKERVRRVASQIEFKQIGQVVCEQLIAYLARNEPVHMRQAWEAEEAARAAAKKSSNGNGAPVASNGQSATQ
jgi:hypothetical protein